MCACKVWSNGYDANVVFSNWESHIVFVTDKLNVMVACGPYTLSDDLEFAPLVELITQINLVSPNLVILMGPFVDARNKRIENGELVDYTFQEQFDLVLKELQTKISKYFLFLKISDLFFIGNIFSFQFYSSMHRSILA